MCSHICKYVNSELYIEHSHLSQGKKAKKKCKFYRHLLPARIKRMFMHACYMGTKQRSRQFAVAVAVPTRILDFGFWIFVSIARMLCVVLRTPPSYYNINLSSLGY